MTFAHLALTFAAIYLNPLMLVVYLFSSEVFKSMGINTMIELGGNCQRIRPAYYLIIPLLLYALWVLLNLGLLHDLHIPLTLQDYVALNENAWTYVSFGITAICLLFFLLPGGMEFNVAGFIFFPILMLAVCIQGYRHVSWLWHVFVSTTS